VRRGNVYFWFIIKWNSTLFCNIIGWNYNVREVELAAKLDACPLCNLVKDIMKCVCGGPCAWKVRRCLHESVCRGRLPRISSYRRRMTSPLSWGCKKGRNSNGSLCVFCPFCAEIKLHVAVHTHRTHTHDCYKCVPDRFPGAMLRHLFRTFPPETPPPRRQSCAPLQQPGYLGWKLASFLCGSHTGVGRCLWRSASTKKMPTNELINVQGWTCLSHIHAEIIARFYPKTKWPDF